MIKIYSTKTFHNPEVISWITLALRKELLSEERTYQTVLPFSFRMLICSWNIFHSLPVLYHNRKFVPPAPFKIQFSGHESASSLRQNIADALGLELRVVHFEPWTLYQFLHPKLEHCQVCRQSSSEFTPQTHHLHISEMLKLP